MRVSIFSFGRVRTRKAALRQEEQPTLSIQSYEQENGRF